MDLLLWLDEDFDPCGNFTKSIVNVCFMQHSGVSLLLHFYDCIVLNNGKRLW